MASSKAPEILAYLADAAIAKGVAVKLGTDFKHVAKSTAATDASNKITAYSNLSITGGQAFPISTTNTGAGWNRSSNTQPVLAMKSASYCYGWPYTGTSLAVTNNIGDTTESGMSFTIPSTFCSTYKVRGFRALVKNPTQSGTRYIQGCLYSSITSSPVQQAKTIKMSTQNISASSSAQRKLEMWFTSTPTLTAGTKYGLGISTHTATDSSVYTLEQESGDTANFDAFHFQQQAAFITRTVDAYANIDGGTATGNFTETTYKRPWIELILDDITFTGGGGLAIPVSGSVIA